MPRGKKTQEVENPSKKQNFTVPLMVETIQKLRKSAKTIKDMAPSRLAGLIIEGALEHDVKNVIDSYRKQQLQAELDEITKRKEELEQALAG